MKTFRLFGWLTLAAGIAAAGTMTASAAEWRERDHHEFSRISEVRQEIARDQARLDQDRRWGNWRAVERDRQALSRDQRELNTLQHGRYDWR